MTRLRLVAGEKPPAAADRDAWPPELRAVVPLDLAVVDVARVERIDRRALAMVAGLLVGLLVFVTLLAPEIWREPWARLAGPLAVYFAPLGLLVVREIYGRGVVAVTAEGLGVHTFARPAAFVRYRAVRRVRRARLLGGLWLETARGRVFVPWRLADAARPAVARARAAGGRIASLAGEIDDPVGFLVERDGADPT